MVLRLLLLLLLLLSVAPVQKMSEFRQLHCEAEAIGQRSCGKVLIWESDEDSAHVQHSEVKAVSRAEIECVDRLPDHPRRSGHARRIREETD